MTTNYILSNVHLFDKEGIYYLFAGDSLRLFEIDKYHYDILRQLQNDDNTCIENYLDNDLMAELLEHEIIVEKDDYLQKINKVKEAEFTTSLSHLTLAVSNDCNLNCRYCFGDGGTYNIDRMMMSFETAKKSIDLFLKNLSEVDVASVVFFGGEPLLNFEVIKRITEYCKEKEKEINKRFVFSITTNGTIITDDILDYFKKYEVKVTISIDGPKEVHDAYRCFVNGNGSYKLVERNIDKMFDARFKKLFARATICGTCPDVFYIEKSLRALGFKSVHMTLVDVFETSSLYMDESAINQCIEGYENLAKEYISDLLNNKENRCRVFDGALQTLYNKRVKLRGCGAGITGIAVNANGNIYPCHRFMGDNRYLLGSVYDGMISENTSLFKENNVLKIPECNKCWAQYICGGGCINTRVKHTGIDKTYSDFCRFTRAYYEIALHTYNCIKKLKNDAFKELFG